MHNICEVVGADLPLCETGEAAADEPSVSTAAPFSEASCISSWCTPFGRFGDVMAEARLLSSSEASCMDPFAARSVWWEPISWFFLVVVIWGRTGTTGWTNRLFLGFPARFTAGGLEDAMASSGRALQLELH
jgi:hypothetical protein